MCYNPTAQLGWRRVGEGPLEWGEDVYGNGSLMKFADGMCYDFSEEAREAEEKEHLLHPGATDPAPGKPKLWKVLKNVARC